MKTKKPNEKKNYNSSKNKRIINTFFAKLKKNTIILDGFIYRYILRMKNIIACDKNSEIDLRIVNKFHI